MSRLDRTWILVRRLVDVLGGPGILIAVFSVVSFVFGLMVLGREYNRPRSVGNAALHTLLESWAKSPDYLGLTLADHVDLWRRADANQEEFRRNEVVAAIERLGDDLDRHGNRYPLVRPIFMEMLDVDGTPIAKWLPHDDPGIHETDVTERIRIDQGEKPTSLVVRYRVAPTIEEAALGLEASYRRLLLALLGMSGYSLLCLSYMVLQARNLSDRAAREAAREATLDLADRTCHELGNGVFVLSNERRNLSDHLDLVQSFIDAEPEIRVKAAARAGLDPQQSTKFDHAVKKAYAELGIDPSLELTRSTQLAREVCRQIGITSDYISLTVRELDSYLKQSSLPFHDEIVDVQRCLEEAFALLGPKLQSANAHVVNLSQRTSEHEARTDRRLLVHVFVNIIKNAVESTDDATITTDIHRHDDRLWITIADNGPGLPHPDKIFESGYTTKGPGRGRGLAVVRESIEAMAAEIKVESKPGQGTTFAIGLSPV